MIRSVFLGIARLEAEITDVQYIVYLERQVRMLSCSHFDRIDSELR